MLRQGSISKTVLPRPVHYIYDPARVERPDPTQPSHHAYRAAGRNRRIRPVNIDPADIEHPPLLDRTPSTFERGLVLAQQELRAVDVVACRQRAPRRLHF